MQGPDYTQWHGAYEMLADLAELRESPPRCWKPPGWKCPKTDRADGPLSPTAIEGSNVEGAGADEPHDTGDAAEETNGEATEESTGEADATQDAAGS